MNRREIFREYMARLDPSDSAAAIASGLYVDWPGQSLADRVRLKAELLPSAAQLVVGGIGSGKTTQLLMARQAIEELGDTRAIYVDFAKEFDIEKLRADSLTALVGWELARLLPTVDKAKKARDEMRRRVYGYTAEVSADDDPYEDYGYDNGVVYQHVQGALTPAKREQLSETGQATCDVYALLPPQPTVALVDSLDRVTDAAAFDTLVRRDIAALREIGIGIVLVGPLSLFFGERRTLLDAFDVVHHLPTVDTSEPAGAEFLRRVLRARADESLLPDDTCAALVDLSGGVPRDLISLARSAGEEAYMAGLDTIRPEHARKAAEALGRRLAFGLTKDDLTTLDRVRTTGRFVETSDREVTLLVTRRVLERSDSIDRFIVHPALAPILTAIAP